MNVRNAIPVNYGMFYFTVQGRYTRLAWSFFTGILIVWWHVRLKPRAQTMSDIFMN